MSCRRAADRWATNLRLSADGGCKHSASFREARQVPFDVVEVHEAMDSNDPARRKERLAAEFKTLWESSLAPPDVCRPIHESLAFRTAELGAGVRVALAALRSARLIRGIGPAQLDQIEIYHDRVRETVLTHLTPAARRWCHDRLAHVLEVSGQADPEVLADHFLGAGDRLRACDSYSQAADKAESSLAFDHAARLYRLAIELDCRPPAAQRRLGKKLGDALSNGGRGAEAVGQRVAQLLAQPALGG